MVALICQYYKHDVIHFHNQYIIIPLEFRSDYILAALTSLSVYAL